MIIMGQIYTNWPEKVSKYISGKKIRSQNNALWVQPHLLKKKKKAKLKLSVSTNFYLKAHVLNWEES